MKYIDATLGSPAENLAWDEAWLELCEEGKADEVLRFWETLEPFVVLGYANKVASEVNVQACEAEGVSVLRRCSGGGAIVQGRGCLSYSLILRIKEHGPFKGIATTNAFIMKRHQAAIAQLLNSPVQIQGHTDLVMGNLKFSGNAQRRRRRFLIFHGTFLLNFDLSLIEKVLRMPSKEPDYRQQRSHSDFVANLNLSAAEVKTALRRSWDANELAADLPEADLRKFARKYLTADWNFKF